MHNIQEAIDVASFHRASPSHLGRSKSIELPTGRDAVAFRRAILSKLTYFVGKAPEQASEHDWFVATALATRDCIVERWLQADRAASQAGRKQVCYFSLEFLIGRLLFDALSNLQLLDTARQALGGLGVDLDRLRDVEPDAALGNGGLGRLAACFMESMASLAVPAYGYGIRYEHGLFRQTIADGWQQERPEDWLARGNPWEFERSDIVYPVGFGGTAHRVENSDGSIHHVWRPEETVLALAFDTPIVGWRGRHVNVLRLWSARSVESLRLDAFNAGDHVGALADRARTEAISRVLYPGDDNPAGRELRLRQQFFFTSASLQDLIHRHILAHGDITTLPRQAAIQLNDTHPAIAVAELMRLLVDQHGVPWTRAWEITTSTLNYTNHTLMPEALESWPVSLLERLLPRHLQIIYQINWMHLQAQVAKGVGSDVIRDISIIDEHHGRHVRMGHLAFLGSHKVNGVSALHTELVRTTVFRQLHELYPDRIVNKTNGITYRRWLHQANPGLTRLVVQAVGPHALDDSVALDELRPFADDASFRAAFAAQRRTNKCQLSNLILERTGVRIDPDAMFDVQIKRIHEYKRQLLNILETVALWQAIRAEPDRDWVPRVKIFAGKAAASYHQAKLIIKLANDVAQRVNSDPVVGDRLKVVFLANYNVSLAEAIIPAADLSEQISTAGMEASGTGNMKLALNGALTIGTLDGANIEIQERVGPENIFIFGLTAQQVQERRASRGDRIMISPRLQSVLARLGQGELSPDAPDRFRGLLDGLLAHDHYMVAADFDAYWRAQRNVDVLWCDRNAWWRRSVLNMSGMGWFSSDRTIGEYASEVWKVRD